MDMISCLTGRGGIEEPFYSIVAALLASNYLALQAARRESYSAARSVNCRAPAAYLP
jgi:hypothetical protein